MTARSSNGRTAAFEAVRGGSNPPRATIQLAYMHVLACEAPLVRFFETCYTIGAFFVQCDDACPVNRFLATVEIIAIFPD